MGVRLIDKFLDGFLIPCDARPGRKINPGGSENIVFDVEVRPGMICQHDPHHSRFAHAILRAIVSNIYIGLFWAAQQLPRHVDGVQSGDVPVKTGSAGKP